MEIKFLLIQILGIIAWVFLILSYHRKDTNKIIIFQIVGNILYCIHYLLLGAYGGLFICFFEIILPILYIAISIIMIAITFNALEVPNSSI